MVARVSIVLLLVWSTWLTVRGVTRTAAWIREWRPPVTPTALRAADPVYGPFNTLLDWAASELPTDRRVALIGPARRTWHGARTTHYKIFRYRMQPRPTRAARSFADLPALTAWADAIVVYELPDAPCPEGFTATMSPTGRGRLLRRNAP